MVHTKGGEPRVVSLGKASHRLTPATHPHPFYHWKKGSFWIQHDLRIITRDIEVVQDEAHRRIGTYEMSLR